MKKVICVLAAIAALFSFAACSPNAKVKVIDIKLTDEEYAFAVQKGDTELKNTVNEFLAEIKSNGTFDEIINKYFGDGTPSVVYSAREDSSKDQLIVSTNAEFPPFEYVEGDGYAGVDMEIAKALADSMGKELVIKDMAFEAVLSALEINSAHIGMAGLTITPDRELTVSFADPYYNASQMVIVRSDDTRFDGCETIADVEAVLKALPASTKVGVQMGTTSFAYVDGDDSFGFEGYALKCEAYKSSALAVQAMINGSVDIVIADEAPAKNIVSKMNGRI